MRCQGRLGSRVFCGLSAFALTLALVTGTAVGKTMSDIVKAGVFNIGVIPYGVDVIKDPTTGEYKGVFVDAIKEVCEQIKVKCVFKEFAWATFVAALQARQIDINVASTYATISRAVVVNFSRPIYYLGYRAMTRKGDDKFKTVEDLNNPNAVVAVCQGCGQMEWVQRVAPKAQLRSVKTEELAILEVVAGRADIVVGAAEPVMHALETQPKVQLALGGKLYSPNQVAWAVNKEDLDILNFINVAIGQLISTGTLIELAKKYKAVWVNDVAF